MTNFYVDGEIHYAHIFEVDADFLRMRGDKLCPLTGKKFEEGTKVVLLMNNCKLFPNTWINYDYVENVGRETVVRELTKAYNEVKVLKEKCNQWL